MDTLEKTFEEIDGKLYQINHFPSHLIPTINDRIDAKDFWNKVKDKRELLEWASTVRKDKWGQKDTFNGTTICESMLLDYNNVDQDLYNSLVEKIYSNKDLARIVLKGASNGGWSFLLLALQNNGYLLSQEQKDFALDEAMNLYGTTRYTKYMDEFEKDLDEKNVSDEDTMIVEFGGISHPVGAKAYTMYMRNLLNGMDSSQAHGTGSFDIRYHILHNPNWTEEEKKTLVHEFWADDEDYAECMDEWEWDIINDTASFLPESFKSELDFYELYNYTKDDLMNIYKNEGVVDNLMREIDFCRKMREYRPVCNMVFDESSQNSFIKD